MTNKNFKSRHMEEMTKVMTIKGRKTSAKYIKMLTEPIAFSFYIFFFLVNLPMVADYSNFPSTFKIPEKRKTMGCGLIS